MSFISFISFPRVFPQHPSARSLRLAGPGLRPRRCHRRPGGSESRPPRGGVGAVAEAHRSSHRGLLQVHPGPLVFGLGWDVWNGPGWDGDMVMCFFGRFFGW